MHYLKINDSDKKKIGYLIHLYRTQQFKHLSQNSFLLNEYNEPICTRQTLSKIEQGVIIKNDSIYEELLKKVNLKFNTDYCIEEFLPTSIFSDLLNACDYYNLEKLISISESYIKQLNPFKEYIFFHEYYECFKWIYTYYSSFELPTLQSTEYIIFLKNIINSNLYEVMMDLVFKKRTISGIYDFSYFDFKNSNSMINRGNHMMILYNQSKLSEMLDYCQDLEEEYSSKNNYIRLLDIYSLKGFAFSNTEKEKFEKLEAEARKEMARDGVSESSVSFERKIDIRYFGQAYELTISVPNSPVNQLVWDKLVNDFSDAHERSYGFKKNDPLELVSLRLSVVGEMDKSNLYSKGEISKELPKPEEIRKAYFMGEWLDTAVYKRDNLKAGNSFIGPAIIEETGATSVVGPGDKVTVDERMNLVVKIANHETGRMETLEEN
mgnify:CR=1 FL=1